LRIALVVHKYPPGSVGGTEIYTQNLARELLARGHEVFVFHRGDEGATRQCRSNWENREEVKVCRVSRACDPEKASPSAQFFDTFHNPDVERAFAQYLQASRPEIVHFQHVATLSYRLIGLVKGAGLPAVLTLHDYWFQCSVSQLVWPDTQVCQGKALGLNCARCVLAGRVRPSLVPFLRPLAAPLLQVRDALVKGAALKADRLISPSEFLIQKYIEVGFPPERFALLENGIDVERIRRYPRQPAGDGRVRFVFLGSLAWQKGVHVLVEAFRGIPADRATLRIVGSPDVFPEYTECLRKTADLDNTSFEGLVPNEDVGRVLADADVLIVPSLWYENSPVVIQEAFAVGVPVIASRIGALAEKVRHGENGLFFPPGEAVALRKLVDSLIEHPEQIEDLREHIPEPSTVQEHVDQLKDIYQTLIERAHSRGG
jgi:glycosyltransferase involved in cell wall biosynthesis